MQEISDFILEIENQFLVRLGTAFLIVFAFWMLSSGISFLVIKTIIYKSFRNLFSNFIYERCYKFKT